MRAFTDSMSAPMGWPPPLMHPPGQVITSMKCRSLRPALSSSISLRAWPRLETTAAPTSTGPAWTRSSLEPFMPRRSWIL